jgi:hypothetical protein
MPEPWELYRDAGWQSVYESPDSMYSRSILVKRATWECDICKQTKPVLEIDSSDGEYLSFTCCLDCFRHLLEKDT